MATLVFKIKICGVRLTADIDAAASAGADAIGLNFFPPSIRYVNPNADETAQLSRHAAAAGLCRVGVFVNASPQQIAAINDAVGLDAIQLHGDESTATVADLASLGLPVIRAIKLPVVALTTNMIADACAPWIDLDCQVLLDADAGAAHGGSGKCLDWSVVGEWAGSQLAAAWTLAGGLDEQNVAEAIQRSGARSVDTASGVEQPRGTKSSEKITAFVQASRHALSS